MNKSLLFRQDLILAGLLVTVIILMIIPLPNVIIDSIIGFNITFSVLLLMVGIYLRQPSDLSTFPSLILIGTAFRLAISVATTRSILTEAEAGQIINTFGSFVVAGNIIVGLVIFLIITIVQFIVITKGSERVAEVAARFCLDAMPGKQMSIDAELRAGTLDPEEGNRRRQKLDKDNQFFGAMDGAMKFVKGDAIAGLIITAVNLIGGIAVGMIIHEYSFGNSIQVYSLLTVGDGLVAQVPALFMSMCAAIIITRVTHSENEDLGSEIATQLASDKRALYVAAAVVMGLGLIPGFPWMIFAFLSGTLVLIAYFWSGQQQDEESSSEDGQDSQTASTELTAQSKDVTTTEEAQQTGSTDENQTPELSTPDYTKIRETERHVLFVGEELLNAIEDDNSLDFRNNLYRKWHEESGINFPAFQMKKDFSLAPWQMRVEFDDVPAAKFDIPSDSVLLTCDPELEDLLPEGSQITPTEWTGQHGFWIPKNTLDELPEIDAQAMPPGHAAMEAAQSVAKRFTGLLFSRIEFGYFMTIVEEKDPHMIKDIADTLGISTLTDILRRLVEEQVPLKPQRLSMEALHQWMVKTKDAQTLVEALRMAMRRQLCYSLSDDNGVIAAVVLEPAIEKAMRQASQTVNSGDGIADKNIVIDPKISEKILNKLYNLQTSRPDRRRQIVVVTAPDIRRPLRNFLVTNNIYWPVISYQEIAAEVKAHPIAMVRLQEGSTQTQQAA